MPVQHPPGAEDEAQRLRAYVPNSRPAVARWLGIPERGEPKYIFVRNHAEMKGVAGPAVPDWAVAVALGDDRIVFRLDRIDTAPANRLELVADHELVHQLLNHLGGERLPRWFEEGLCVSYAGLPFLETDASLELAASAGWLPKLSETDTMFRGDAGEAAKAYKMGHRAVTFLLTIRGDRAMRALLQRVSKGDPFPVAFQAATGMTVDAFEERWRDHITPSMPFLAYLLLQNIGSTLIVFGAFLVFIGWLIRRLRRRREFDALPG